TFSGSSLSHRGRSFTAKMEIRNTNKCSRKASSKLTHAVLTFTKENIVVVKKDDRSTAWQDVKEKTWDEMFFVNDNEEEDADLDIAAFWNIE
ncbi:hypothetical protein C0991_008595, partial [Blastosporella zonata]